MLALAGLLNKMDPPSPAPPSHKAAAAGGYIIQRTEPPLPEQIWRAHCIRLWHTKYGIIVGSNHHDDSCLDKRGQIPFLYPEFLKYCFVKKNQFLIFLVLTWKGYNWSSLNPLHHPGLCERLTHPASHLSWGQANSSRLQHLTPMGPKGCKARTHFTSFG